MNEQERRALTLKEKPWLIAEPDSWWVVTGKVTHYVTRNGKLTPGGMEWHVTKTLLQAWDESEDEPIFMIHGSGNELAYVAAKDITCAVEVLVVRADDPRRAAWAWDQQRLDEALA